MDSLTKSSDQGETLSGAKDPKADQSAPAGKPTSEPAAKSDSNAKPADSTDAERAEDEQARNKRKPIVWVIGIAVVLLLIAGGLYYWYANKGLETTDDAFTDGRTIDIAPQVSGVVTDLFVSDNQFVHKSDPLIHIDPRQYQIDREQAQGALDMAKAQLRGLQLGAEIARKNYPAQLEQAQAKLASAKAAQSRASADLDRQNSLPKAATTQQAIDAATAALADANAQVMLADAQVQEASPVQQRIGESDTQVQQLSGQILQAQAKFDQTDLNFSYTTVTAPQDGWVTKRNVEVGNYVTPGQKILSIVSPQIWITANFKENQLADIRPGQSVDIRVDAYPKLRLKGHIDSVQSGSGSKFSAFPAENATGNFIKIVQRVPVKIVIDSGLDPKIPLPLGLSVEPTVHVE